MNYKICALCEETIESKFVVCRKCLPTYMECKHEDWMQELVAAQARQYEVDKEEINLALGNTPSRKRKTRKLSETDKKRILEYHQKGLGAKNIAKILDANWFTIRQFIDRRNKNNTNK
jgi:hypothetical protein